MADNTAESDEQQLWYWIEVAKCFSFYDGTLTLLDARRLAEKYLQNITPTHPDALLSTINTLLAEADSFQRYLILGVLFPAVRRWSRERNFVYGVDTRDRTQRLKYWHEKQLLERHVQERFEKALDPMLNRKWLHDSVPEGEAQESVEARIKMNGFLARKFTLMADIVYMWLVQPLSVQEYVRDRFHGIYYASVTVQMASVKHDPLIANYMVEPEHWPSYPQIDEEVVRRCAVIIGAYIA